MLLFLQKKKVLRRKLYCFFFVEQKHYEVWSKKKSPRLQVIQRSWNAFLFVFVFFGTGNKKNFSLCPGILKKDFVDVSWHQKPQRKLSQNFVVFLFLKFGHQVFLCFWWSLWTLLKKSLGKSLCFRTSVVTCGKFEL